MNIKSSINLIRGILYLHEIIRCKSISRAAEENNMKASNLGIIINDLEKQTGTKLLKRTHLGSSPTAEGLRVAQYAVELEEQIQKIRQWHENTHPRNRTLNIYIAPNMETDKTWKQTDRTAVHSRKRFPRHQIPALHKQPPYPSWKTTPACQANRQPLFSRQDIWQ